ncbi:MAG TPA: hemerythrin domain-containing protein, partial [Acidothermaceae bacterium]
SVHGHLRSELDQIRNVIAEVAEGRSTAEVARSLINDMSMRQNYWSLGAFCATYCRVVTMHHSIEDAHLFTSLKLRDAELGPVIDRLAEEHEVVAEVLTRIDLALIAMVADPESLSAVKAEVDRLADVLFSHLAYEEEELIGPITRLGIDI